MPWLVAVCAALVGPAAAAPREALVIAVARYQSLSSLANPVNDARLIAAALRASGFSVAEVIDPDRASLVRAIADFRGRATGSEAAIVYFAGHGVEIGGSNYLLPHDAEVGSEELIKETAVRSSLLGTGVSVAQRMRLLVLDACRDNPFANLAGDSATRSVATSRGLAREEVKGVVTMLATAAGQRAADQSSIAPGNSPFARAFAEAVQVRGLDVIKLPTRVTTIMAMRDRINQRPDQTGVWPDEDFQLLPAAASAAAGAAAGAGAGAAGAPAAVGLASVAAAWPAATAPNVAQLGLRVQRENGASGIHILTVDQQGPAFGKVFPNDIIVRLNGEPVDDSIDPAAAIEQALAGQNALRVLVKRGLILINTVLRLETE